MVYDLLESKMNQGATGGRNDFGMLEIKSDNVNTSWRVALPASRDKYNFSLFKSTIGKDLTRITMPVFFNEPLSFLQRLTEDLEYADILNRASDCESTLERLCYVAAFASSAYANVPGRFWKPFNPLLGETFEFIDKAKGYAAICEQVSHHPPVSALHAESDRWVFWEEYRLDTRFRGLFVKIVPTGRVHLRFKKDNSHYSWKKPETRIHNIVIGSLWVDHDGETEIISHNTDEIATVHFTPYRKSRQYKLLRGVVKDRHGVDQFTLEGAWDEGLVAHPVNDSKFSLLKLWTTTPKPEESARFYGFTSFAMQLNQPDESVQCPTDSRRRPDQRLLEFAKVDEAASEKHRLEEKQRHARKLREHRKELWKPRWFALELDPDTDTTSHVYIGGYWTARKNKNFDTSPDIF